MTVSVADVVELISVLALLSLGIGRAALQHVVVDGTSMEPTLGFGARVVALRFGYALHRPRRGDVALCRPRMVRGTVAKRIVGVPGDELQTAAGERRILGASEYYLLGDNRQVSWDSRDWGPLDRTELLAPCLFAYWPRWKRLRSCRPASLERLIAARPVPAAIPPRGLRHPSVAGWDRRRSVSLGS